MAQGTTVTPPAPRLEAELVFCLLLSGEDDLCRMKPEQGLPLLTPKLGGMPEAAHKRHGLSPLHAPPYLPMHLLRPDSFGNFHLGLARPELHSVFQFFILQGKKKKINPSQHDVAENRRAWTPARNCRSSRKILGDFSLGLWLFWWFCFVS